MFHKFRLQKMSLQEVLGISSQLGKADDADRQLDLVQALTQVNMTFDILVESKVGAVVKPLKKSELPALAGAAKDLLNHWKSVRDKHVEAATMVRGGVTVN